MSRPDFDLEWPAGDSVNLTFTLTDSAGAPYGLTGMEVVFYAKSSPASAEYALNKSSTVPAEITIASNVVTVKVAPGQLPAAGRYPALLQAASATVRTSWIGYITATEHI